MTKPGGENQMPVTIDELKKDALLEDAEHKDFALKENLLKKEAERKKQQQEIREKIEQERANQDLYMDEGNERGEKQTYWQYVTSRAEHFTKFTGQQSYIEFSTCIMDLFGMYVAFAQHLTYSKMNAVSLVWKYGKKGGSWAWDKVKNKVTSNVPEIEYGFHIDENGVLETKLFQGGEGADESQKIDFDTFFVAWLQTHGIECDVQGHLTQNGEPVSTEMVEQLDATHPFSDFLRERAEINARYRLAHDVPEPENEEGHGLGHGL